MKTKKTTRILHETHEVLSVRSRSLTQTGTPSILCEECKGSLVAPEDAALAASLSTRAVYRLVEAGKVHFKETTDGRLLVCVDTVNAQAP